MSRPPALPALESKRDTAIARVLMIPRREPAPPFFHYEPPQTPEPEPTSTATVTTTAGRAVSRFEALKDQLSEAENRGPRRLRSTIRWLRARLPTEERLMRALRTARVVELDHPSSLSDSETRAAWNAFVARWKTRHMWGVVIYGLLLLPTAALFVLPGPNMLGIWVAVRLVMHGLALWGALRASSGRVAVFCRPIAALDGPILTDPNAAARLESLFGWTGLKSRLRRERLLERWRRRRARRTGAA